MTVKQESCFRRRGPGGAAARSVVLAAGLLTVGGGLAPVAAASGGRHGLAALFAAWAICLASGLAALLVGEVLRRPDLAWQQVLLGMAFRSGFPLAACLLVYAQGGFLAEAGLVYYLLALYFAMLSLETLLLVLAQPPGASG